MCRISARDKTIEYELRRLSKYPKLKNVKHSIGMQMKMTIITRTEFVGCLILHSIRWIANDMRNNERPETRIIMVKLYWEYFYIYLSDT